MSTRAEYEAIVAGWRALDWGVIQELSYGESDRRRVMATLTRSVVLAESMAAVAEIEAYTSQRSDVHYMRGRTFQGTVEFTLLVSRQADEQDAPAAPAEQPLVEGSPV